MRNTLVADGCILALSVFSENISSESGVSEGDRHFKKSFQKQSALISFLKLQQNVTAKICLPF